MSDRHITPELMFSVLRGRISANEIMDILYHHVSELCPQCRAGLELVERYHGGEPLFPWLPEREEARRADISRRAEELAEEAEAARPTLEEILDLPPGERRAALAAGTFPANAQALASLLLEESLACLPGEPREALELARLARVALAGERPTVEVKRLYARAMAYVGNALRVQSQLREAGEAIADARFWLAEEAGGPPLLRAELDRFEGSLRRDERHLEEAIRLFKQALDIYLREDRAREAVMTALKLGMTYREAGELDQAILITRTALQALQETNDTRLLLMAVHNLCYLLDDAGRAKAARRLMGRHLALYASFPDPWTQLRRLWLEGKIARNLTEPVHAEHCLRAARDGFLAEGIGYDAALVSLDLAVFYLEQGKTGAVKQLAEEIAPVFLAQDVHREALAALSLFQEAARREAITAVFVRELALYLEAARKNPEMAFRAA